MEKGISKLFKSLLFSFVKKVNDGEGGDEEVGMEEVVFCWNGVVGLYFFDFFF